MKKLVLTLLFAAIAQVNAAITQFDLQGTAGPGLLIGNEPAVASGGSGGEIGAGIFFDATTSQLTVNVGWGSSQGFTDLSSLANNSHIHGPTTGNFGNDGTGNFKQTAPVIFNLARSADAVTGGTFTTPPILLTAAQRTDLFNGKYYINLHTANNGGGEIRGFLVPKVSIGINFEGRGDPTPLANTEVAGVVPQGEWNNINSEPPFFGTASSLTDNAGNFTVVTLSFDANDSWNSDGGTVTPNEKLMYGIMKRTGLGNSALYTFDNVPAGSYDVYVYTSMNGDGHFIDTSINGGTTNYTICQHQFTNETFIRATNTVNLPASRDYGNYVKFTGVSPVGGQIAITATAASGDIGTPAIQLVGTGTFPPNTLPLSSITAPADRTNRISPFGFGLPVSFTVTADLPAHYQWFKNNVLIPGATGKSYTTPATTLADNGATFHAIATNNVNSVTSSVAVLTAVADPNLLLNGDLNAGGPVPPGWTRAASKTLDGPVNFGGEAASFANDSASVPGGANGFWFHPFGGNTNDPILFTGNLITVHLYQDIPGKAGQIYTLTGHARAEGNYSGITNKIPGTPTKSLFAFDFLSGNSNIISSAVLDLQDTVETELWGTNALTATAPAGTATVRARASMIDGFFSKDPQQSYFVDNFELTCAIPMVISEVLSGASLTLSGTCGKAGTNYNVLASTDVTLPLTSWTSIQTNQFDAFGNFSFTINPASGPQRFFVIRVP